MSHYLGFTSGGIEFVIDAAALKGVIQRPALRRIPLVPGVVAGMFVCRGRVWTAIDVAMLAGGVPGDPACALLVDHGDGDIALMAARTGNIFFADAARGIQGAGTAFYPADAREFGEGRLLIDPVALMDGVSAGLSRESGV
ncbi:MAG: chemotaxis protein CheW [Myxococcota bacterium]